MMNIQGLKWSVVSGQWTASINRLLSTVHCSPSTKLFWGVSLICGLALLPGAAEAERGTQKVSFAQAREQATEITVTMNRSSIIQFDQPIARLSLTQPAVADPVIISRDQILLNGKAIGSTSLIVWSKEEKEESERPATFTVKVVADIEPIVKQIKTQFPNEQIEVEQVDGRAVLSGSVSSQRVIDAIPPFFEGTGLKVINLLGTQPQTPRQVILQVRVAEVNRRIFRELGTSLRVLQGQVHGLSSNQFNIPGGSVPPRQGEPFAPVTLSDIVNLAIFSPSLNLATFIRALNQRNAFRSLAEPNIIAMDGQEASFLAGGEFPYPVVQGTGGFSSVTIQFREFGTRLKFKPTIVDENHIRLELTPEVSALDFVNGLQLSGFRVPALVSRTAKTTVELADGQSFALAGLLSNDMTRINSRIPWLGDIPILGYLFRSQSYIRNETELVFLCTARLVKPVGVEELPPIPGQEEWKKEGLEGPFGHRVPKAERPDQQPKEKREP